MTPPLPRRDCFDCTPEELALAQSLGSESRERIVSRIASGTPLLVSIRIEADYIADAWAQYNDKVQLHAIYLAFDMLHHENPTEAG